jgi:hypothetical protein
MTRVVFPDHLLAVTSGVHETELVAGNFRELLLALDERWPGAAEQLGRCAVAIDGQIYQDAFLEPLNADSEVFFMQRIEGG